MTVPVEPSKRYTVQLRKGTYHELYKEAEERSMSTDQLLNQIVREYFKLPTAEQRKTVFLVFKQGNQAKDVMRDFVEEIGLKAVELSDMSRHAEGITITDFLSKGFEKCQAFLVLLTPDDEAQPREEWIRGDRSVPHLQPRQNVMVETGMGLATRAIGTILVYLRPPRERIERKEFKHGPTDIEGIHYVELSTYGHNKGRSGLPHLIQRLQAAGCAPVNKLDEKRIDEYADQFANAIEGENWTATTQNHAQGADHIQIDLDGRSLDSINFRVESNDPYWRAGFILGEILNPDGKPSLIMPNSFLFHIGMTQGNFAVNVYHSDKHLIPQTTEIEVGTSGKIYISFECKRRDRIECCANNFIKTFHVDPTWRRSVYLAAWGDFEEGQNQYRDYSVEFTEIAGSPPIKFVE